MMDWNSKMWYRTVLAETLLEEQLAPLGTPEEDLYPELEELLLKMGKTTEDYFKMNQEQQKEIWNILITGSGSNLYNEYEDEDTPGFNAMEAARHSPYHDLNQMNMEQRLERTRHDTTNVTPGKKNENTNGVELVHGPYQERTRKMEPRIFGNLPSNISLI